MTCDFDEFLSVTNSYTLSVSNRVLSGEEGVISVTAPWAAPDVVRPPALAGLAEGFQVTLREIVVASGDHA